MTHLLRYNRLTLLLFVMTIVAPPVAFTAETSEAGNEQVVSSAAFAATDEGKKEECDRPLIVIDKSGKMKIVKEAPCYSHAAAANERGCTAGTRVCNVEGMAGCDTANTASTCQTVEQPACKCKCQ